MFDQYHYSLTIAEMTVEVVSVDARMALRLDSPQKRFQVQDARPDVRIEAAFGYTHSALAAGSGMPARALDVHPETG